LKKILVIQTAFIGDVILATAVPEHLHKHFPDAQIDMLVRTGNESLFKDHPFINKVYDWKK
jgi:heptosyltransferase-2